MGAAIECQAASLEPERLAEALEVDPRTGLRAAQLAERRARFGPNTLRRQARRSALTILAHQFKGIIVWLLAAAAGLSIHMGDRVEAAAILVVLAINTAIGFATEFRAARSMEALNRIAETRSRVRRDGQTVLVDARDLVPGDVVLLEAGDVVTADMRLVRASNLEVDESVLTGESLPVGKQTGALPAGTPVTEQTNMVFKGTAVTEGTGEAIVVATGMATELGRISELAQTAQAEISPLERRLDRLGQRLVWLTLGLTGFIVAAGALRGRPLDQMLETGIALAVAAVPEGLPVVATLCLARGMWRMAPARRADHPAVGGRDAGGDDGDLDRQDRHPDREPHDRDRLSAGRWRGDGRVRRRGRGRRLSQGGGRAGAVAPRTAGAGAADRGAVHHRKPWPRRPARGRSDGAGAAGRGRGRRAGGRDAAAPVSGTGPPRL